ncbi:MAG: tape measure protein [Succinivibrionaceae bacterium]|nr:tape measure protein [Succinivibrionaceae bacterium]
MSNNVDKRVVEMQFDNKQFEDRIQKSVKSLDDLKKGLDLEKSAKGLEAIDKAARNIDLRRLADAAQSVADRFSFMGNLVQNVYNRIGDAALNAAMQVKNFVEALTIDPVKTGLEEYETQINSIQTILSNTYDSMAKQGITGESERVAIINDRLDTLNHYADKTIYNFTQMTESIGRFTAAGVDLDTSVAAIQGIANLAAVSGSNAEQASNAMYMLSQAMSAGTVTAYQWNSVMRAGMGGEVFQKAILRNAKAMGKTVDVTVEEIGANGKKVKKTVKRSIQEIVDEMGFKESLSKGWFTSDILAATLDQFSWDFEEMAKEAGYTKETMEEGIAAMKEMKYGELLSQGFSPEEAKEMIRLAEDATNAATKVKTFTQLFDTLKEAAQSGWTETWRYIIGDFEEAKELLTSISEFFGNVIGEAAEARNEIVKEWKDLGGRDELIQSFWNIVYTIQNIVGLIHEEFQKVFPPKTGQQLFDMTKGFRELTDRIRAFTENEEKMDKIRRIVAGFANALDIVRQVIGGVWDVANQVFGYITPYAGGLVELIAKGADKITEFNQHLKETGGVQKVVEKVVAFIKRMIDGVKQFIQTVKDLFSNGPEGIVGKLKEWFGHFQGIGEKIGKFFDGNSILSSIKNFFSGIIDAIKNFAENANGADIAVIIGALLGGGLILKIRKFVKGLVDVKDTLVKTIKKTGKGIGEAIEGFGEKKGGIVDSILKIAASLALIAGALYIVSKIDSDRLGDALLTMGIVLAAVTAFAFVLSKIKLKNATGLAVTSAGLMLLGGAMLIFAAAIEKIGKLDDSTIIKGIAGLGAVLLELTIFMALTKKAKMGIFKGAGLVLLAVSLNLFAKAVEKIGGMDTGTIVKGVAGLGAVLLELAVFLALTKKAKLGVFKGAGLILLAVSLNLFANAISKIGGMDTNTMIRGIAGLGGVLLELAIFLALTKKAKLGVFKGVGLILMAVSINMFANAISKIGGMDTDTMIKGIAGLGAVLLELGVFLALTKKAKLGVFKGVGLILMAVSINMFANAISKIGGMDTHTVVQGIAGLGAVLLELAVFLALTKKAKLGVFKGAGLILMAVSINMFANAIEKIGTLETGTIVKGLVGLGVVLLELAAFLALTKKAKIGVFKGAGLILMAVSLNMFADTISKIGKLKTKTIIKGVAGLGLVLLELAGFMKIMNKTKITGVAKGVLLLGVMALSMQVFVKVLQHLEGIEIDKMLAFSTSFGIALLSLSGAMLIMSNLPIGAALGGIVKLGLVAAAIVALMAVFGAAEKSLNVSSYIDSFGDLLHSIGNAVGRFVGGLAQGVFDGFSSIGTELSDFMTNAQPFLDGIKDLDTSAVTGVGNLVSIITQIAGANVIEAISSWISGGNAVENFAKDMECLGNAIVAYTTAISDIKDVDQATIDLATSVAKGLVDVTNSLPRSGGLAQKLIGAKDLGDFADDIPDFGKALQTYANTVSGFSDVDQDTLDRASTTAGGIVDLANKIPRSGGLAQKLIGAKSIADFSADIPALGEALKAYVTAVSGFSDVDQDTLDRASTTAGGIVDLANKIPRSGGLAQKLIGAKSIGEFAGDIPALGEALKTYASNVSGFGEVDEDSISKAATTAGGIVDLANKIPRSGGLAQKLIGAKSIGEFAGDIPALGIALKSYATNIRGFDDVDTDSVNKAQAATEGIVAIAKAIPRTGGLAQRLAGAKDLGDFAGDIPALGEALKSYASSVSGFSEVDANASNNALIATQGIVAVAKSLPRTGGLAQRLVGAKDLADFSADIPALGKALSAYVMMISGFGDVDAAASANALTAAQGIAAIATSLPAEGGLAQQLLGAKDLGSFAGDIPALGEALSTYASSISGFSEVDVTASENALAATQGITALLKEIPAEGGWAQKIFGAKSLAAFSEQIPTFGEALKEYATFVEGFASVDATSSANALAAANGIVGIVNALPATGGLSQKIKGAKSLADFSDDLPGFGVSLSAYAAAITDFSTVDQNDIDSSINAAKALKGFADTLDESGGWIQAITGRKNLSDFATGCANIGSALASFASNIGSVSIEETENATTAMGIIKEFTSGLNSSGGIFNDIGKFFGGEQDIVGLSEKMAIVGTNLSTFATNLGKADFSNTEQATQVMTDMQTFISTLETKGGVWSDIGEWFDGKKDIVGLSNSMATFANNFSTFATGITGAAQAATDFAIVQEIVSSFSSLASTVEEDSVSTKDLESAAQVLGTTFVTAMVTAISDNGDKVSAAAVSISSDGSDGADGTYKIWYATGENLGKGLANGIASMADSVKKAATNAAAGATRAIQITWSVHSPSRVGYGLGMNFDLGIAGGLDHYSKIVSQSAAGIGENAVDSAKTMLRGVDGSVFDYIDPNPTIRPVLDLSNVRNGVGTIGSMLNSDQIVNSGLFRGINFSKGVNALNFDGARIVGGVNNKDVVSELQSLANRFDGLNEAVHNMKVVLDSGELVGATSGMMDRELGVQATRKGRGN